MGSVLLAVQTTYLNSFFHDFRTRAAETQGQEIWDLKCKYSSMYYCTVYGRDPKVNKKPKKKVWKIDWKGEYSTLAQNIENKVYYYMYVS